MMLPGTTGLPRAVKYNMKRRLLYLAILVFPLLSMVAVNEFARGSVTEDGYTSHGITAINSAEGFKEKCSWACHNDTKYCKEHHVKLAKPYFAQIDPIYFGIIRSLQSTGNYGLANIIFLVILIPLLIYILLVKSIRLQRQIRHIKKGN